MTGQKKLTVHRVRDRYCALGVAVSYLMAKPAFARLGFGHWAGVLTGQINRDHYFLVFDGSGSSALPAGRWPMQRRRRLGSPVCRPRSANKAGTGLPSSSMPGRPTRPPPTGGSSKKCAGSAPAETRSMRGATIRMAARGR